jgi:ribosomal protein S18 acetylase RimI-like enzyme
MRPIHSTSLQTTAAKPIKPGLVSISVSETPGRKSKDTAVPSQSKEELASRKLAFLRRSGLFGEDTKGATIERACSVQDLRDAYRLVHSVYLGTGYIGAEPAGMRLRIFEMSSETATFVAKVGGRVVGVLSVVGDSPDLGLPSDAAFKPELDAMRATGARLCEVTNQAVAEEFRKSAVPTELMRCAIALTLHAGYNEAVATVSPSHSGFYDLLRFRKLGTERSYSQKLHDPVIALTMNVDQYRDTSWVVSPSERFIHHYLSESNHFLSRIADWSKQARRLFLNSDLLEQLFVKERNFLAECSPGQLRILQRRWGQELFGIVSGAENFSFTESPATESPEPVAAVRRLEPAPDAAVIFAGHLHTLMRFAKSRLSSLFSGERGDAESWITFPDSFISDRERELSPVSSLHDVSWQ